MHYYLGIDGGGTKTEFLATDASGTILARRVSGGCSYRVLGVEAVASMISSEVDALISSIGSGREQIAGCCAGLACVGEDPQMDAKLLQALQHHLAPIPVELINDVEVGWAGSLGCSPGIHVVSGTGAIAYGRRADGCSARCGGWHEFFGDEGSCYWIGRQAMSLFSKEADGRVPRGPLYDLVREKLALTEDFAFIDCVTSTYQPRREAVAAFQLLAQQAALDGDRAAVGLYEQAAAELSLLVLSLRNRLWPGETGIAVSYGGGLFHAGTLILLPFSQALQALGCTLQAPLATASEGAADLARQRFAPNSFGTNRL